jgi:hypothetical protein
MYTTFLTTAALFSVAAIKGVAADFAVNNPELVQVRGASRGN